MKKLLTLFVFIFIFTSIIFAQNRAFTVQGGYSWTHGMVGVEYQYSLVSVSAGWMPVLDENLNSYSGAITIYNKDWNKSGFYFTGAFASIGFGNYDVNSPMGIGMIGYKYQDSSGLNLKGGGGYGWSKNSNGLTCEITLGWSFGL